MTASTPVAALLSLLLEVVSWFGDAVEAIVPIFWADGNFTFIGAITGVGVGFAITLLVVAMIRSLIRFQ